MTPEERSLLERTASTVQENNDILRSIRRATRISMTLRILYWVVIILAGLGAYYFIQPYVESVTSIFGSEENQTQASTFGIQERVDFVNSLLE